MYSKILTYIKIKKSFLLAQASALSVMFVNFFYFNKLYLLLSILFIIFLSIFFVRERIKTLFATIKLKIINSHGYILRNLTKNKSKVYKNVEKSYMFFECNDNKNDIFASCFSRFFVKHEEFCYKNVKLYFFDDFSIFNVFNNGYHTQEVEKILLYKKNYKLLRKLSGLMACITYEKIFSYSFDLKPYTDNLLLSYDFINKNLQKKIPIQIIIDIKGSLLEDFIIKNNTDNKVDLNEILTIELNNKFDGHNNNLSSWLYNLFVKFGVKPDIVEHDIKSNFYNFINLKNNLEKVISNLDIMLNRFKKYDLKNINVLFFSKKIFDLYEKEIFNKNLFSVNVLPDLKLQYTNDFILRKKLRYKKIKYASIFFIILYFMCFSYDFIKSFYIHHKISRIKYNQYYIDEDEKIFDIYNTYKKSIGFFPKLSFKKYHFEFENGLKNNLLQRIVDRHIKKIMLHVESELLGLQTKFDSLADFEKNKEFFDYLRLLEKYAILLNRTETVKLADIENIMENIYHENKSKILELLDFYFNSKEELDSIKPNYSIIEKANLQLKNYFKNHDAIFAILENKLNDKYKKKNVFEMLNLNDGGIFFSDYKLSQIYSPNGKAKFFDNEFLDFSNRLYGLFKIIDINEENYNNTIKHINTIYWENFYKNWNFALKKIKVKSFTNFQELMVALNNFSDSGFLENFLEKLFTGFGNLSVMNNGIKNEKELFVYFNNISTLKENEFLIGKLNQYVDIIKSISLELELISEDKNKILDYVNFSSENKGDFRKNIISNSVANAKRLASELGKSEVKNFYNNLFLSLIFSIKDFMFNIYVDKIESEWRNLYLNFNLLSENNLNSDRIVIEDILKIMNFFHPSKGSYTNFYNLYLNEIFLQPKICKENKIIYSYCNKKISSEFVSFVESANNFSKLWFLNDEFNASFEFYVEANPEFSEINLQFYDSKIKYRNGPKEYSKFIWPNFGSQDLIKIEAFSVVNNNKYIYYDSGMDGLIKMFLKSKITGLINNNSVKLAVPLRLDNDIKYVNVIFKSKSGVDLSSAVNVFVKNLPNKVFDVNY